MLTCTAKIFDAIWEHQVKPPAVLFVSLFVGSHENGTQQEDMSIPATSMALQTHSGTSPLGNYQDNKICFR